MPITIPLREALTKLNAADFAKYKRDVQLLGKAMLRQGKDGAIFYVPPADFRRHRLCRRSQEELPWLLRPRTQRLLLGDRRIHGA